MNEKVGVMNIQVGKYILRSDQFCLWVDEEYEQKNGKTATRRVAGYSTSFKSLLSSLTRNKVLEADAEDLYELVEALRDIMRDMEKLNAAAVESGFSRLLEKENT